MRIALTGGIACGKSTFSHFLFQLGASVIDADDVVHGLESPGGKAVPFILERFGQSVIKSDGSVDRQKLAEIVFSSPIGELPNSFKLVGNQREEKPH